ncbi:hypothetical protein FWF48_00285 [Candidatus Saccharibacteria bacterium]|nr:hypothetical protein [Candidatus Saccharibacteria bacterium]
MDTQQADTNQVDEQELAKALADVEATNNAIITDNKKKKVDIKDEAEEPATIGQPAQPADTTAATPSASIYANATPSPGVIDAVNGLMNATSTTGDAELESVKTNALQDLKPLIDKLDISPEEKFDIYLLIFKTADDPSVVEPAYNVAKQITDEAKKANALLEIIKEVDAIDKPEQAAA